MPAARQKSCAATCNRTESPPSEDGPHPMLRSAHRSACRLGVSPAKITFLAKRAKLRPAPGQAARWTGRKVDGPQGGRAARWTGRKRRAARWTGRKRRGLKRGGELPRPQSGRATLKGLGPSASLTRGAPPHPSWARATQARSPDTGRPVLPKGQFPWLNPVPSVEPNSPG